MHTSLERFRIAMYAIGCNISNKFRPKSHNNRVLLIFQQVFGDSIVLLPALEGYMKLFYEKMGYEVTLLCRPSIKQFLEDTADLPDELKIETIDYKKLVNVYSYFKKVAAKYRSFAEVSIVMGSSLSAELLSTTLASKERHGLISCYRVKWPLQMALFQRLAYNDAVIPPVGSMMIQRHRIMLNHLGLLDFKGHLPSLKKLPKIIEGEYCVICPGASTPVKCWPIERFRAIADWIIDTYHLDVHLCGGAPERKASEILKSSSRNPNHIFNHVGETSFAEWSSIVQHASLVIGNDSATLHIAAATHRKCICITGIYDKFMFFPYVVDELREGEFLPETIVVDKPCAYCRTKGYFAGFGNRKCKNAIKKGGCALCIEEIMVEDVKVKVSSILCPNL